MNDTTMRSIDNDAIGVRNGVGDIKEGDMIEVDTRDGSYVSRKS